MICQCQWVTAAWRLGSDSAGSASPGPLAQPGPARPGPDSGQPSAGGGRQAAGSGRARPGCCDQTSILAGRKISDARTEPRLPPPRRLTQAAGQSRRRPSDSPADSAAAAGPETPTRIMMAALSGPGPTGLRVRRESAGRPPPSESVSPPSGILTTWTRICKSVHNVCTCL